MGEIINFPTKEVEDKLNFDKQLRAISKHLIGHGYKVIGCERSKTPSGKTMFIHVCEKIEEKE